MVKFQEHSEISDKSAQSFRNKTATSGRKLILQLNPIGIDLSTNKLNYVPLIYFSIIYYKVWPKTTS